MKISQLFLFVLLFIFLYGCSEKQPYKPEKDVYLHMGRRIIPRQYKV